jgi:glycosyltransferase involved in cell wall biosynthesis
LRATPFSAGTVFALPVFPRVSRLQTADDAQRARQALADLPEACKFEALGRWPETTFDPLVGLDGIKSGDTTRPKILYVSPGSIYSGAEESLRCLAQGLAALEFQQTAVVSLEGVLSEKLREIGCQVISANWYFNAAPTGDGSVPHATERFAAAVLDRAQPDFIHCNADPGPAFLHEAQRRGKLLVAHVRNAKFAGAEDFLASASHLIAVSEFVKHRLEQTGIADNRITVIYNGVDVDRFCPDVFDKVKMRRKFGLPADAFVAVMIASFIPGKRHDLMIEAFHRLRHHNPSVRLVLVGIPGDPQVMQNVRAGIENIPQRSSVKLLPFQEDIREIQCAADVVVLPSDNEAFPRCILEAMALGIPTVASDNGGARELIENGVSGLLMAGGDATSLAAVLQELFSSEDLRSRFAGEGRKRVERNFTLHGYAQQVQRVLYHCAGFTCSYGTCRDTAGAAQHR